MLRHNRMPLFLLLAGLGFLCALAGCQSLPNSGFDPSGQRLFESNPFANCPLFHRSTSSSPTTTMSTPIMATPPSNGANMGASVFTPPAAALPGGLGAARTNPAVPQHGSTATIVPPGTHAVTTALIHNPQTGTTRPVFADTGGYALPTIPVSGPALIMTPREQIAPLGSEVVLIASRLGERDRLVTHEKIEWALEGVGTIEKIDTSACGGIFHFDYEKARKVTERYAITKTSNVYQTLDRGTPDTTDDVHLLRGQTWVSVNSMKEGTTHVTAFAPNMADWSKRTDVGIIHWVDAQWVIPRLAIAPVGETRVLTTTVLRATNGQPRHGWIVRYEILNGPAAGLGGSGAQIEEVETDASGQATTILTPGEQRGGTNTIGIQIIRPAGLDNDQRVTVGSEMIRQTWAGNPNILLNIGGPREARLGQELLYEITAENRTSSAVHGHIALPIPPLASYIRSEPPGRLHGSTVLWEVDLPANSTRKIDVVLQQGTPGSLWLRPEFRRTSPVVSPPAPSPVVPSPVVPSPVVPSPVVPSPPHPPAQLPEVPSVFQPSQPPVPPSTPPSVPPTPSPSVFTPSAPTHSLSVQIETDPIISVRLGSPFRFYVRITNTGTNEVRNILAFFPLPSEFAADSIEALSNPLTIDGRPPTPLGDPNNNRAAGFLPTGHQFGFQIPSLPPGATAFAQLQYPSIGPQGHEIVCSVLVDGQQVTQERQRIMPVQ